MYTQQNTVKLDPALEALLAVAQQVTPSGQPTIAKQVADAAQQQQAPQGIVSALQQSATTAPSVAQNMQPMPPEGMPPQGMPPEGMPPESGGIAALPLPGGQYAEGGVVGYEEGGPVGDDDTDEATSTAENLFRKAEAATEDLYRGIGTTAGDFFRSIGGNLAEFQRKKELEGRLLSAQLNANPGLFEPLTKSERASRESQASQMAAFLQALRDNSDSPLPPADSPPAASSTAASPTPTAAPAVPKFVFQEGTTPQSLIQALAYELKDPTTSPAARIAISQKIQELAAQTPPTPDRVRPSDLGIMAPRDAPRDAPQGIAAPTISDVKQMAGQLIPPSTRMAESNRLYDLAKSQQEARPDFEGMRAKMMEEAAIKEQGGRGMEQIMQALAGMSRGGNRGAAETLTAYTANTKALDSLYKEQQIVAQEAQSARQEGNLNKLIEMNNKMADLEEKRATLEGNVGASTLSSLSSQFNTKVDAQTADRQIASNERVAQMGGVQGALMRMARDDPKGYADYLSLTEGGKTSRAAQIDKYADDYNKLAVDMVANQKLEKLGIKTLEDYIRYRDLISGDKSESDTGSSTKRIDFNSIK